MPRTPLTVGLVALALLEAPAIGADPDCVRTRWLLELRRIDDIDEGIANPYAETWLAEGVLEPAGEAGPETMALRVRSGPEGEVVYATVDALAIESSESCRGERTCVAGPRTTDGGKDFALYEGTMPDGDLSEEEEQAGAEPPPLLVEVGIQNVWIVAPSATGKYTVQYEVVEAVEY